MPPVMTARGWRIQLLRWKARCCRSDGQRLRVRRRSGSCLAAVGVCEPKRRPVRRTFQPAESRRRSGWSGAAAQLPRASRSLTPPAYCSSASPTPLPQRATSCTLRAASGSSTTTLALTRRSRPGRRNRGRRARGAASWRARRRGRTGPRAWGCRRAVREEVGRAPSPRGWAGRARCIRSAYLRSSPHHSLHIQGCCF